MNKEELFSMPLKTEEVTAFGQTFLIQEMSGIRFEQFCTEHDKQENKVKKAITIILFSVVDDDGNLAFDEGDAVKLADLEWSKLNDLAKHCAKFSNVYGEEKN